jgi:multicomponent Na+:H+ antiporter subunit G
MIYIGYFLLIIGMFSLLTSFIGIIRFPDFFTKIHAASIADSFAIPINLIGLSLIADKSIVVIKLLMIAFLYLLISPISANAIAKSALLSKEKSN